MLTLLRKEINSFFSSLIGYLVIIVFLLANGLFLWVFPGDMNILNNGYSDIAPLFDLAPWIFLFLVPAVTMRLFAEEKRTGTIELLYTRPLTDLQIVLGKYFAGLTLVILALVPTLLYFYSAYDLGIPKENLTGNTFLSVITGNLQGNLDVGATWGSFIGLLFLSAIYVAIGVFSSALSENQIVSFILAMVLSFVFYLGFEALAMLRIWGNNADIIENFGINAHYLSMSRGVIDSRDLLYFLSVIGFIIYLTQFVLRKGGRA